MYQKKKLRLFISRARRSGRSRLRQRRTRQPWRFLAKKSLLHYSVLIASYAQGAILLCIVGQELHDHQSPGLPEQEKQ